MTSFPCLIFSSDGYLCDEMGDVSGISKNHGLNAIRSVFDSALGHELYSFKEFCKAKSINNSRPYRIYRVFGLEGYEYAFCEKNTFLNNEYTFVYLARDVSEFHKFITPSSSCYSNTADKIIYELLYLRNKQRYAPVCITSEAFLTLSRIPFLTEAIFDNRQPFQNCDICIATEHILAHLHSSPLFRDYFLHFNVNEASFDYGEDKSLLNIPLEAFVTVLLLSVSIASALSCDRTLDVTFTKLRSSAAIRINTHSDKIERSVHDEGIQELSHLPRPIDSFSKIATVIAMVTGLGTTYSYDETRKELSLDIVLGGEIPMEADFKHRDPADIIDHLTEEIQTLYELIN